MLIGIMLQRAGFETFAGQSAQEALGYLQVFKIDLLITDFNMPEMNGLDLIRTLRKRNDYQQLPIVMLSSWGDPEMIERSKEAGANDYWSKPMMQHDIITKLNNNIKKYIVEDLINIDDDAEQNALRGFINDTTQHGKTRANLLGKHLRLDGEDLLCFALPHLRDRNRHVRLAALEQVSEIAPPQLATSLVEQGFVMAQGTVRQTLSQWLLRCFHRELNAGYIYSKTHNFVRKILTISYNLGAVDANLDIQHWIENSPEKHAHNAW